MVDSKEVDAHFEKTVALFKAKERIRTEIESSNRKLEEKQILLKRLIYIEKIEDIPKIYLSWQKPYWNTTTKPRKGKGTQEWCDKELAIEKGCKANCYYCYAKRIAQWGGWIPTAGWDHPTFNLRAFNQKLRNWGTVMFPTSHNIDTDNLEHCRLFILRLLRETDNKLLIVTKPHFSCTETLGNALLQYQERVEFRFTITSMYNETLKKYEPNAPDYFERKESLKCAFFKGYKTSVSIEPFLDIDPTPLMEELGNWISGDIWLGAMSGRKYERHSPENLKLVMKELRALPMYLQNKIKIKNSLADLLKKYKIEDLKLWKK